MRWRLTARDLCRHARDDYRKALGEMAQVPEMVPPIRAGSTRWGETAQSQADASMFQGRRKQVSLGWKWLAKTGEARRVGLANKFPRQ